MLAFIVTSAKYQCFDPLFKALLISRFCTKIIEKKFRER